VPYIVQAKRDVLDPVIEALVDALRQLESDDENNNFEGNVNYAISKLLDKAYSVTYRDVNDVVGVLECIKLEYYRRVAVPYENQKSFDNGDVYAAAPSQETSAQLRSVYNKISARAIAEHHPESLGELKDLDLYGATQDC
jgi:hypothetical protein